MLWGGVLGMFIQKKTPKADLGKTGELTSTIFAGLGMPADRDGGSGWGAECLGLPAEVIKHRNSGRFISILSVGSSTQTDLCVLNP